MTMENELNQKQQRKRTLKEFLSLGEVGGYFFRKKDPNRPDNVNIKIMHGVNRLSIIVFLLALIYLVVKRFFN